MPRTSKRFLVPLVLLAGIAACVINLNFDVAQTLNVTSNNVTSISGSIAFRAETAPTDGSQDVALGNFTLPVTATGTAHLQGNHAVDSLLVNAVKGTGKLTVILNVTGVAPQSNSNNASFALKTTLHMALGYNTGIF